jgi:ABC-type multidrug transport system fused ATPase/permease subunit
MPESDEPRPEVRTNLKRSALAGSLYGEMTGELAKQRSLLAAWSAASFTYSAAHSAMALAAGALAHAVSSGTSTPTSGLAGYLFSTPPIVLGNLGLAAAAVKAVAGYALVYSERVLAGRVAQRSRLRTLDGLLRSGTTARAPELLARVATRCADIESAMRLGALGALRAVIQLVPLGAALLLLAPRLARVAFAVLAVFGAAGRAARRYWRTLSSRAQSSAEALHREVNELVANVSLWRTYGAGQAVRQAVDRSGRIALLATARVAAGRAAIGGANEVLAALALVAALGLAGLEVAGNLLAFAAVFFMAYRPLRDLGDARAWLEHGHEAVDALRLLTPAAAKSHGCGRDTPPRAPTSGMLELFEFGAVNRGPRTSAGIDAGSITLLRGPTGSGKTTLFLALLGLEEATGRVRWAGRDITQEPVGPGSRPFAWVPQDAPLVTGTLADNVALAAENAAYADALAMIGAGPLADELGSTIIGPGGQPISGGQRRLVSLARAVATALPVLLLDEPTEGLDQRAAHNVLAALQRLRGVRTIIMASHRPELERVADAIVDIGLVGTDGPKAGPRATERLSRSA